MPLYSEDGQFFVNNSFYDSVVRGLDNPQFSAEFADGLVVGAVGNHAFSI